MNSRSLMAMVGARAMRAKEGMDVTAIAMMMFVTEGPSIATRISPRMSEGKASSMSIVCITMISSRPPYQPAMMPMAEPMTSAIAVEAMPMTSEMRAP